MTRTTTGLSIAAALGFAVSVGAQSPTTTPSPDQRTSPSTTTNSASNHEVTVTGCLSRAADGTYMLNNARIGEPTSPSSSPTTTATSPNPTTTNPNPTGTSGSTVGTTAAEPSGSSAMAGPAMWKLEDGKDLERHVGHKIQVTGKTDWNEHSSMAGTTGTTAGAPTGTTATGATTTAKSGSMNEPKLEVSSVKMIASSCQ